MLVLDTCVLLFDALAPVRLTKAARLALDAADPQGGLSCSDISLWEIAMLIERGRLDPGAPTLEFLRALRAARGLQVLPISPEIAARSATLPLHGDPADRLIAATTVVHGAKLVTSDRQLLAAPDVPTIW